MNTKVTVPHLILLLINVNIMHLDFLFPTIVMA